MAFAELPAVVRQLLATRGVTDQTTAQRYFQPSTADLADPGLMLGLDKAVARLQQALDSQELIYVLGDYDADGICGTVLLAEALADCQGRVVTYTPDRFTEGYGISMQAIEAAKAAGAKVFISVDCGTKNHVEIAAACQAGIDVIVCDHHLPEATLPPAYAILNPKQAGDKYPNKDLCGCGVAFTLWHGLAQSLGLPAEKITAALDLVAIATCADAVPLLGQNRTLVALGLEQIREGTLRPGMAALLESANLHPEQTSFPLDAHRVVYSLAPRLNAAGRMAHGSLSVDLLRTKNGQEAEKLAEELEALNNKRRDLDQLLTAEALEMIRSTEGGETAPATVLVNPTWSLGVLGITASRLLEHYPRPTIVLTEHEGHYTGSARSGPGFDVYAALEACADLLVRFGGHSFAAGLTLKKEDLGLFMVRFSQLAYEARTGTKPEPPARTLSEATLEFKEITPELCRWTEAMAPYGPGNPRPLFKATGLMLLEDSRVLYHKVTKQPNHLMLMLADKDGYVMEAAGWGMAKLWDRVSAKPELAMTFHLELYRNRDGGVLPRLVIRHLDV